MNRAMPPFPVQICLTTLGRATHALPAAICRNSNLHSGFIKIFQKDSCIFSSVQVLYKYQFVILFFILLRGGKAIWREKPILGRSGNKYGPR